MLEFILITSMKAAAIALGLTIVFTVCLFIFLAYEEKKHYEKCVGLRK